MEPALILQTSTILLAIAAVGGVVMAGIRFATAAVVGFALPHSATWKV